MTLSARTAVAGLLVSCVLLFARTVPAQTLLDAGSSWKYLDDGSDQGSQWREPEFDDSRWRSGAAHFGYGDGDERTLVSYGASASTKYITTYFRRHLSVDDPAVFDSLTLRAVGDDGIIIYINGVEVWRENMPSGSIVFTTRASKSRADENKWRSISISPAHLTEGTNVVAVEVHQSSTSSSDLSFDLELLGVSESSTPTLTRGPYLQTGTSSTTIVRWRTSARHRGRVRYGTLPTALDREVDETRRTSEHVVTLDGLLPDTRYYYSVGTASETLAGGADYSFTTAPTPGTAKPTRIWVIGDAGTANINQYAVRDAYYEYTGSRGTDLWLMLGDNAVRSGTDAEYQRGVFEAYTTMLRSSVLWPTFGNHDAESADSKTESGVYYDIFSLPRNGEAGGIASGTEAYYSFDYGNIHFICLDTSESSRAADGPMANWLRRDLQATTADWVIAFWHHPPYTKGSHDSDKENALRRIRENLVPILEDAGVDLVLSGHSHSYERSYLIDRHYADSSTFGPGMLVDGGSGSGSDPYRKARGLQPHGGTVYAVAGSSGGTAAGPLNHPVMFESIRRTGSVVLDVSGTRLDFKFIDSRGAVLDSFSILK
jgi:hypothetical protein